MTVVEAATGAVVLSLPAVLVVVAELVRAWLLLQLESHISPSMAAQAASAVRADCRRSGWFGFCTLVVFPFSLRF